MRELKYYVASSLDGYIAHHDGTWDGFLQEGDHLQGFFESLSWFDVVVMGRRTYEVGLKQGVTNPYPNLRQIVFSTTMDESPHPEVELVTERVIERVEALKREDGKPIWLCGGSVLADGLMRAGLIDEIVVKFHPVLFGSGIPLFSGPPDTPPITGTLALAEVQRYDSGVVVLHYRVVDR